MVAVNSPEPNAIGNAFPQGQYIFISYSPGEAPKWLKSLAGDLERRGYPVWIDWDKIEAGASFDVRIEEAIRACSVLLAILTPKSVREESVCRDEIEYALKLHKRVIPVRADPQVLPPLRLVRKSWIDWPPNYEDGVEAVVKNLEGADSDASPPGLELVTGHVPLDFGAELARYSADFVGREWVIEDLEAWLARENTQRAFIIVGEPGLGKSSISACLSRREDVLAVHFCVEQNKRSLRADEFVAGVVDQLSARLPGYKKAVVAKRPELTRASAGDAYRELVIDVLRTLPVSGGPKVLVVDALDEALAQTGESIVDVVVKHLADLPSWLRIVATTRPEPPIIGRVRHQRLYRLEADAPDNVRDIDKYIRQRLSAPPLKDRVGEGLSRTADRIKAIAEGNFLCARLVLDSLAEESLSFSNLKVLAPGLAVFFKESFRRKFPDPQEYRRSTAPILQALIAGRGPLSARMLSCVLAKQLLSEPSPECFTALRELRVFLREEVAEDGPAYVLFHNLLGEWLRSPQGDEEYAVSVAAGHAALADYLWQEYRQNPEKMPAYAARHLPAHFAEAKRWEELLQVVRKGRFKLLERWTEREPYEGIKCLLGLIEHLKSSGGDLLLAAGYATQLARIYSRLDQFEEAERWLLQALKWGRSPKGRRTRAIAYHELGSLELYRNDEKASERLYRRALILCERYQPRLEDEASANLVALAVLNLGRYDYKCAVAQAGRGLTYARKSDDWPHASAANRLLANVAKDHLRFSEAIEHLQAASVIAGLADLPFEKAAISHLNGWLHYQRAALQNTSPEDAIELFKKAIAEANRINHLPYRVGALIGISQSHLLRSSLEAAAQRLVEAQGVLRDSGRHPDLEVSVELAQGSIELSKGQFNLAKEFFRNTATTAHKLKEISREADAWMGLGAIEFHTDKIKRAKEYWQKAEGLAKKCSPLRLELIRHGIARNRSGVKCPPL